MKHSLQVTLSIIVLFLSGCGARTDYDRKADIDGDVILRVYLVRHAQAYKNVPHPPGTPAEKLDSLTPEGQRQAAALGEFLADKSIAAVVTSPTGRTRQTAEIIGEALGLDTHYYEDSSFASIKKGKTSNGRPTSWSWRKEQLEAGRDPRPVGGESFRDGLTRARRGIRQLADEYTGKAIAIVSHSDICAALLGHAADTSIYESLEKHTVATGSVSEIIITGKEWFLPQQGYKPACN